ncbi:MAG: efflux RND transporter periplasmic adaptor subunit [Cypionkella sp.]
MAASLKPSMPARITVVPTAPAPLPLKQHRPRWPYIAGLAIIVAIGAGAFVLYARPWLPGPIPVLVETATPGPVTRAIAVNGRVAARSIVELAASVSGRISGVFVEQGDLVSEGDLLAQQDDASGKALLRQAFAALDAGIVRQQQAAATVASDAALAGNIPRITLEADTRSQAAADREVDRLQAALDQAQSQLGLLTITSPMSGTIVSRGVEVGQLAGTQGTLFVIADLTKLVVQTDVDELYASQVRLGQGALLLPAGQTSALPGAVSRLGSLIDDATGGLAIEMTFATPQVLPLGMTVTANIVVDQSPAALTVPRSAILPGPTLYLVRSNTAVQVPIAIIDWPADRLVVTDGLAAGDVVITTPAGVSDGSSVSTAQE